MLSQTLKKTFDNGVTIKAVYFMSQGGVWLHEEWFHEGERFHEYFELEPWLAPNVGTIARKHDWNLYPDAMHL